MQLSLCMIVRDEAAFLARCLSSVAALVDEIVIVDTGSVDDTIKIAKSFGARVSSIEWPNDFALARNASLALATGDWILVLDADEYLDQQAQDVLAAFKVSSPPPTRFRLKILTPDDDGNITGIHYMCRLFPRAAGIHYEAPLHEYVIDQNHPPTPSVQFPQLMIHHSGLQPELMQSRNKLERNRAVLEQALQRFPQDQHCLYHLAGVTIALGKHAQAWVLYQRLLASFRVMPAQNHPFFVLAIIDCMACLEGLNQLEPALQLGRHYEPASAHHPAYWLLRGHLARRIGQYDEARTCFWSCLNIDETLLDLPYRPTTLNSRPLLKLLQLNRALSHHPGLAEAQRQFAQRELTDVIGRLLQLWPEGNLEGLTQNLYLLLAESLLESPEPETEFIKQLPSTSTHAAEDALLLLRALNQHPEALNVLSSSFGNTFASTGLTLPEDGLALAGRLRLQGENFKAVGLLHLGALKFRRPDWMLVLSDWLISADEAPRARQLLLEARLAFPDEQVWLKAAWQANAQG